MKNEYNLFIQLDAILDTRYACLEKANPKWAISVLKNRYHKRITNNFHYDCHYSLFIFCTNNHKKL